jgi:hypothetical protein
VTRGRHRFAGLRRAPRLADAPPPPRGAWCEVTVADLDRSREWLLAGFHAPTLRMARLWLRWQSRRLADLIDPDPGAPWLTGAALGLSDVPGDPAAALRRWPSDIREYARLEQAAAEGSLYVFTVTDDSLRYCLSHRPLFAATLPPVSSQ